MTTADIKQLLPLLAKGKCSTTDLHDFDTWLSTASYEDVSEVTDLYYPLVNSTTADNDTMESLHQHIENRLNYLDCGPGSQARQVNLVNWKVAAAMLALLAAAAYFLFPAANKTKPSLAAVEQRYKNDVAAGTNKAILTLGNGSRIQLDSTANKANTQLPKGLNVNYADGSIYYTASPASTNDYNTLTIPNGGQYNLTLVDGSRVWLNAASSLKFPRQFEARRREVMLTGEAYFEVTSNQQAPFIVKSGEVQVQVMGTHFNVKAYPNDNKITTTLLEGAVKLVSVKNSVVLEPGKEGIYEDNQFVVNKADMEGSIAWKNGLFLFNKCDLNTIMQQFERWYDISVVYEGAIPANRFVGEFKRELSLAASLKILELSGVRFTLVGKQITVLEQ